MFENIISQDAVSLLKKDLEKKCFPGAVLFCGNRGSAKLSSALEVARLLSCQRNGSWLCDCPECLLNKALVNQNVLILGPRDCTPEISAASETFLNAVFKNASYLEASRYLFIRSVRKLTSRFNQVLWKDDSNLSKIASVISEIDENLETLDFPHKLPSSEEIQKVLEILLKLCIKLESDFLYDSIPINNIRNVSSWAHLKSKDGKKTVIIENADRMLENVRNALLKILEEPPEDTVFILTASKKNAVMPTILSRVRPYYFTDRSLEKQQEVIRRVFHNDEFSGTVNDFLLNYLPVKSCDIEKKAEEFLFSLKNSKIPQISVLCKECNNFEPRIILKIFLNKLVNLERHLMKNSCGASFSFEFLNEIKKCYTNIVTFNQSIQSAFEILCKKIINLKAKYKIEL